LREDGFRVVGLVRDLLAEVVPLAELLADDLDDVVGVVVGLREYKRLGHFAATGEYLGQFVAEGADDSTNLVEVDDVTVKLAG
jgi:hypothetical protein